VILPNHCGTCRHGDANGVIGTEVRCTQSQAVKQGTDACDVGAWAEERRSFERRFPDYPYAIQDNTGRLLKQRIEAAQRGEAELVQVQPGVVQIRGKTR